MKLGMIGFGFRGAYMLRTLLQEESEVILAAVADVSPECASKRIAAFNLGYSPRMYLDAAEMLQREELDGVIVSTRCNLHTRFAVMVLERGIPLFLEKPVSTTMEDLIELKEAGDKSLSPVVVSFPLRVTSIVQKAKEIVDSGELGKIENVNAFNDVPYGGVYYHGWYRDEDTTHGLFLQKATHDFDVLNCLLPDKPVSICAMSSKQIFKGDMPAGLRCDDCERKLTCTDGKYYTEKVRHDDVQGEWCCFAVDTGNEDSGSALIKYDSGMHASYSQNFFARKKAARRGARLYGYRGTLEFDFYAGEKVRVYDHFSGNVTDYEAKSLGGGHGGGDNVLMRNFSEIVRGETDVSVSPLDAGILSALMCLRARESAQTERFCRISF